MHLFFLLWTSKEELKKKIPTHIHPYNVSQYNLNLNQAFFFFKDAKESQNESMPQVLYIPSVLGVYDRVW